MGRYKKILVAVDGSVSSRNAFRQACRIAREDVSWVTALMTVPILQDQYEVLSIEKAARGLRSEAEKVLSEMKNIGAEEGVNMRTLLEEGNPLDVIRDVAEEGGYDLIVMGRRGMTHLERAYMGSVTARVIGHTATDVLVIQRDTPVGWKKILFATDGSLNSSHAEERVLDMAAMHGSEITVLSVADVNEEFYAQAPDEAAKSVQKAKAAAEEVKRKAEAKGLKATAAVKEGEPFDAITSLAKSLGTEIIVMGSHGRTGLKRLLMGSVTEKVIGHTPCPVYVVK